MEIKTDKKLPLLELWYMALSSPKGICVRCSLVESVKALLYTARQDSRDEALKSLQISISPFAPDEIWITHKGSPDEKAKRLSQSNPKLNDIDI